MKKKKNSYTRYYFIYGLYALITLCAVYFSAFTRKIALVIMQVSIYLDNGMATFMSSGPLALHLKYMLSLALSPIVIVAIPTAIYWGIKKKMPPYLIQTIWVLWIIVALSRLLCQ